MSDVKISALPAVTSVATTDVIPVVTGGVTSKIGSANFVNSGLSGGTANGVLYLNGSKAATSGSALTFDGTNLALGASQRLLVGKTSSDANNFGIQNYGLSAYTSGLQLTYGGVGSAAMWVPAASSLAFGADGASGTTEQMRLTSTGLGIGTSSPAFTLDVGGQNGTNIALRSTGTASTRFRAYVNGSESGVIGFLNGGGQFFEVAGTEQMRLTTTGLGIGTSSPGNRLHVQASGDVARFTNGTNSAYFAIDSAGFTLFTGAGQTGNGLYARTSDNSVQLWTNSSAKVTLDSSGNLGIGTLNPSQLLNIRKDQAAYTWGRIENQSSSGSAYAGLMIGAFGNNWGMTIGSSAANSNALCFVIDAGGGNSEKMRLDSSGNLGIGTTANASAILDAQSTTKGVRFPNMTTTQKNAISSPAAGLVVFDTTLAKLCVYSGAAWQTITSV